MNDPAVWQGRSTYSYENKTIKLTPEDCDQIADDIGFLYRNGCDVDRAYEMVLGEHGLSFRIEGTFDEGIS